MTRHAVTKGGALLRRWLKTNNQTQEWLGSQIGTRQTTVSAWILGRQPPIAMAVEIRRITGIEVEDWAESSNNEVAA